MRLVVTGRHGQVAQSLLERAAALNVDVHAAARPDFDLARPAEVERALIDLAARRHRQRRRLHRGRSRRKRTRSRLSGSMPWARKPPRVRPKGSEFPSFSFRPTMCSMAALTAPIARMIRPTRLAFMATASSGANTPLPPPTATTSSFAPPGSTVRSEAILRAPCSRWRVERAGPFPLISDQLGAPTNALDLADGIIAIARNLLDRPAATELRGVFHITGGGDTNWAGFAAAILAASAAAGGSCQPASCRLRHRRYPTAARRPANSRLDNSRLAGIHGVRLPCWQQSLQGCIERLVAAP